LKVLIDFVDDHPELEWIITENVKVMFHRRCQFDNEVPMDIQNLQLAKRGFITQSLLPKTMLFGIPQSRDRALGLYIRKHKKREGDMKAAFFSFQSEPLPIDMFITNDDVDDKSAKQKTTKTGKKWKMAFRCVCEKLGEDSLILAVFDGGGRSKRDTDR